MDPCNLPIRNPQVRFTGAYTIFSGTNETILKDIDITATNSNNTQQNASRAIISHCQTI